MKNPIYSIWPSGPICLICRIGPIKNTLLLVLLACMPLLLAGCGRSQAQEASHGEGSSGAKEKTLYTCGMHPQVVQDHPGNCPICGMKLTPIHDHAAAASAMSGAIQIDPVTIQNMGIRTATVTRGPLRSIIRTLGTIDYDETSLADVTTKFKGWVEKLHVNATGQLVMRGDPLFEIYSPDLYSAQRELLLSLDQGSNAADAGLKDSALTKLRYFDISDEQIAEVERTRQPRKTLDILAPRDGFVIEKDVVEGQMVEAGARTYRLADLGLVWVQAQIYEQDLVYLKLGQEATVTLDYLPDREFRGRLTYIYPNVDEKTRTAKARLEFHNPGYYLKPGMFATVQVVSELAPSALLVPDAAILRSGEKKTVFVALDGGKFEPRAVTLGPQAEHDYYEVLSGLAEGERIVTSGQFMLDSESQLREAIQKMLEPGKTQESVTAAASASNAIAGPARRQEMLEGGPIKYICPMPEHVSIEYEHPGKCPICGMTLVPVPESSLRFVQPGGKLLYYTCPMPEHSDVRSDKPGKCPKCGMTLIPVMALPAAPEQSPGKTNAAVKLPTLYTCPMASHADVVSDKPGECPKCGMALVETTAVAHGRIAEEHWLEQHPQAAPLTDKEGRGQRGEGRVDQQHPQAVAPTNAP